MSEHEADEADDAKSRLGVRAKTATASVEYADEPEEDDE